MRNVAPNHRLRRLLGVPFAIALLLLLGTTARAASPLSVAISQVYVFRHLVETGDWLVMGILSAIPTESTTNSDSFSISTTSGAFDDPAILVNRVYVTGGTDYTVVADSTDITAFCTLGANDQTVDCTGTGLGDATYTVVITYRSGWDAYATTDIFVRLMDGATIVAERNAPTVGWSLVGIYLTAAEVASAGLTWIDPNVTLDVDASPILWASPSSGSVASGSMTWRSDADHAALATTLTADLRTLLTALEANDSDVTPGTYVQTQGIPVAGAVVSVRAFSLIQSVIPEAFLSAEFSPQPTPISTPTVSLVVTVQAGLSDTTLNTRIRAINPMAPTAITILASIALGIVFFKSTGYAAIGGMAWFTGMTGGWLLFGIPFPLVFIPIAAVVALGFVFFLRQVYD